MKTVKFALAATLVTALSACHDGDSGSDSGLPAATPISPLTSAFAAGANTAPATVNDGTTAALASSFGGANGAPIRFAPGTSVQSILASATP